MGKPLKVFKQGTHEKYSYLTLHTYSQQVVHFWEAVAVIRLTQAGDFGFSTKNGFLQSGDWMNCIFKVYFSLLSVRSPRVIYVV